VFAVRRSQTLHRARSGAYGGGGGGGMVGEKGQCVIQVPELVQNFAIKGRL